MKWRVILEPDSETGDIAAWCPELSGCSSVSATELEAITNIKEAIALYLEPDSLDLDATASVREVAVE